jgi:hypothetical protein
MLFVNLAVLVLSIVGIVYAIIHLESSGGDTGGMLLGGSILLLIANIVMWCGLMELEPNEARVITWFGKYAGTFSQAGYYWINPFYGTKKLSLRARNLDVEPIKVNDKVGNPVMIGLVLVWKLKDTYRALFEVDTQTMATSTQGTDVKSIMNALEKFVRVQSDAALRQVAGQYAYDDEDGSAGELTLRSGSEDINRLLEEKLDDRLALAGIEVVEARINRLAGLNVYETDCVPDNGENLAGFVTHPSAMAVAMRYLQPIANYDEAGAVTDPVTGLTFGYLRYTDTTSNKVYITLECLYGYQVIRPAALQRITVTSAA